MLHTSGAHAYSNVDKQSVSDVTVNTLTFERQAVIIKFGKITTSFVSIGRDEGSGVD